DSLKGWPPQLQRGIDAMENRSPLEVERSVVFRNHVLPIRFLAHFNVGNWVVTILQVSNLGGSVLGRVIKQRYRNHRGQPTRDSAGVEKIESNLCLLGG